mmetsp:Transcript_5403/g.6596  ORF Transcript_5403/g.6596 Transcript_5403/m.6596 type:complete len:189 (-) Transcript_5403:124-690(-)|eukprot:jgi/Bigna1/91115/estExt_fgenesh1_pg.C_890013
MSTTVKQRKTEDVTQSDDQETKKSDTETKKNDMATSFLVCVDGSEQSKRVVEFCSKILYKKGDKVTLFHVYTYEPVPIIPHMGMTFDYNMVNRGLEKRAHQQGEAVLNDLVGLAKKLDMPVEPKLYLGNERTGSAVKYDIEEYARTNAEDFDFLVCGSRGMGAIGRALVGSVADYLVHNSKISTVIVK